MGNLSHALKDDRKNICSNGIFIAHSINNMAPCREFFSQFQETGPKPMLDVSASDVRRRVAHGEPVERLLERPVCTYIRDKQLYVEQAI